MAEEKGKDGENRAFGMKFRLSFAGRLTGEAKSKLKAGGDGGEGESKIHKIYLVMGLSPWFMVGMRQKEQ